MATRTLEVERGDLEKILDAISSAYEHHRTRDESNAIIHLAPTVRYSPLTSLLSGELNRLAIILGGDTDGEA